MSVDGRDGGRPVPGGQVRNVFGLLVTERDRCVDREELAGNLWPRGRPATWKTALRGVVARLRRCLVDAGVGGSAVIRAEACTYRLHLPGAVEVDVERAVADAGAALQAQERGDAAGALEAATRARRILAAPLVPGVTAPWLETCRRTLARRLVTTLEVSAAARLALGRLPEAVAAAGDVTALDPYRESAHRIAIRAHLAAGDVATAVDAYERCRTLLAADLGIEPSPETTALLAAVRGHPSGR